MTVNNSYGTALIDFNFFMKSSWNTATFLIYLQFCIDWFD